MSIKTLFPTLVYVAPLQKAAAGDLNRRLERECIQLAVLMEYTHTEIAERLGTPLGTVKNRLRRALTKLRTLFSDER